MFSIDSKIHNAFAYEDHTTIRGKKKLLDRVTLVVCCNATRIEKVPITIIGKAKEPGCIVRNAWSWLITSFSTKKCLNWYP